MKNNLFPIAKEGWKYLLGSVFLFLCFTIIGEETLQVLSFAIFLLFAYLFRNPERELPLFEEKSVLSPIDGTVRSIESIDDAEYAYRIIIESNYKNVGVLRSPINAINVDAKKRYGARLGCDTPLAKDLNENVCLTFTNNDGDGLCVQHRLKQSLFQLSLDPFKHKKLVQSQRYGFMLNGVTELHLPHNFRMNVKVGEELIASETLLGYFF